MIDFEDQIRSALARKEPSPDFARKVLARASRAEQRRSAGWQSWAAGCLAASLLLGGIGLAHLEQRRDHERARSAHAQLVRALEIASSKLQRIEQKLERTHP